MSEDQLLASLSDGIPVSPTPKLCVVNQNVIDPADVDQLAESWSSTRERMDVLSAHLAWLREAMLACSTGDEATRRVRGSRFRVKITEPSEQWDSRQLASIAARWPEFVCGKRPAVKPERFKLMKAEWKKMLAEDGPVGFAECKDAIEKAYLGRPGNPRIEIEEFLDDE